MQLNKGIIQILSCLHTVGNSEIRESLQVENNNATILSKKSPLLKVTDSAMYLFGDYDVQKHITVDGNYKTLTVDFDNVKDFFNDLSESVVRLNHVGIAYSCKSFEEEAQLYAALCQKTPFSFYNGQSDDPTNQWYFIGERHQWMSPLFELVLAEKNKQLIDSWTPHFQIDVDTNLEPEVLEKKIITYFGSGFDWKLNLPKVGVVLGVKILGEINGTKICLGTGTTNRGTQYHREKVLTDYS